MTGRFENNAPHSESIPNFYRKCIRDFKSFVNDNPGVSLQTLTSRIVYWKLIESKNVMPEVIGRNPGIDFSRIFKNLNDPILSPEIKSLNYRTVHGVLSTNDRLFHRIRLRSVKSPTCQSCGSANETMDHLFFQCPVTHQAWDFLEELLFGLCNHRLKASREIVVLGALTTNCNAKVNSLILLLVGIMKHSIWVKRCALIFRREAFDATAIKNLFISQLKLRVLADVRRYRESKFDALWCINDVICKKENDVIHFNI